MKKTEKLYLTHIVEAAARLASYLPATFGEYSRSAVVQDAVIKVLGNITESASHLEETSKREHPDIPWKSIQNMRNILVHEYLGDLNQDIVWKSLHQDLPELVRVAQAILKTKYNLDIMS